MKKEEGKLIGQRVEVKYMLNFVTIKPKANNRKSKQYVPMSFSTKVHLLDFQVASMATTQEL